MNEIAFRMDDVGAATKQHEVYGKTRFSVGSLEIPFPGNFLFLKYIKPFKEWGRYDELSVDAWAKILDYLVTAHLKLTVGITAGWVEKSGNVVPFPEKFRKQAEIIKRAVKHELVEVANHGYTHCVLEKKAFRPKLFSGNRKWHREFWEWVPLEIQESHLSTSQRILEDFFGEKIVTFIPPGNVFTEKTLGIAKQYGLRYLSCGGLDRLPNSPLIPIPENRVVAFHDKELQEEGLEWLRKQSEMHTKENKVKFVREIGRELGASQRS